MDPSYGTGGIVTVPLSSDPLKGFAVKAVDFQAGGKVIVAGDLLDDCTLPCRPEDTFHLSRLHGDGSLDPSFGDGGVIEGNLGIENYVEFTDALVDTSNRILVAGTTLTSTVVVRLDPDGSLDSSFGDGGVFKLPAPSGYISFAPHLAQQSDGRTVVEWVSADNRLNRDRSVNLFRLLVDGSQDETFGDAGVTSTPTDDFQRINSIEIDSADRVVIGEGTTDVVDDTLATRVLRYSADGSPDSDFGTGGQSTIQSGPLQGSVPVLKVAIDGSDRIVALDIAGRVTRLLGDGTLDPDFGVEGTAVTIDDRGSVSLGLAAGGAPLVAGPGYSQGFSLDLARYLTDGGPDLGFGVAGASRIFLEDSISDPEILVQPDGRILLIAGGGYRKAELVSARYRVDTDPPDDADADGVGDADDACPGRYGPGDGCPQFTRTIRLHRDTRSQFVGKVTSSESSCLADSRIVLFRQAKRGDRRLGSVRLEYQGPVDTVTFSYAADRDIRDSVYAVTSQRFDATRGICERAQSQPTRVIRRR